ncbi:hypothetical protein IKF34_02555 [Candidatus Saccharibacteria bacterium]|nr:hypothetical protein [Candidatus Saccharibacteria bacterium]
MPDENTNQTTQTTPPPEPADNSDAKEKTPDNTSILSDVNAKIADAQNILIALSSDPTVDELAAAIGLSIHLDRLGKHATAIYSGSTPNALEFLKPSETLEPSIDALQDFVIALSKEKADHLRYKLDGDYVKIYITPYRTRISKDDLNYSYGDFNIDLVLALNVSNGIDLDDALREHGRIMHDASIINITAGNPGKFGEIQWSDKTASSISEMVARLLFSENSKIDEEEATAFLTGIVSATNRFSNAKTSPIAMQISSQLMESGANQQLISKNITPAQEGAEQKAKQADKSVAAEKESEQTKESESVAEDAPMSSPSEDPTKLDITHEEAEEKTAEEPEPVQVVEPVAPAEPEETASEPVVSEPTTPEPISSVPAADEALLDDLQAAADSLSMAGAETTPDTSNQPIRIEEPTNHIDNNHIMNSTLPDVQPLGVTLNTPPIVPSESVIAPSVDFSADTSEDNKYGKMLEDALSSAGGSTPAAPEPITAENINNPAALSAPAVSTAPEINGVPQINYATPADAPILPPPPAPPIAPAAPMPAPTPEPLGPQPAMQDQVYTPQAADPSAFQIPGM